MSHAKENNLLLKIRHSKVLFCGSSGAGKTNFINLLLNKNFVEDHKSTGVTESHQLMATQVTINLGSGGEQHNFDVFDYDTQIKCLNWCLKTGKYEKSKLSGKNTKDQETTSLQAHTNNKPKLEVQQETGIQIHPTSNSDDRLQKSSTVKDEIASVTDTPPGEPPDVWELLTFLDTGGQPEFITLLPTLNSSAMITFIVHSMEGGVEHLTDKITVYENGEEKYKGDYDYYHLIKMLFSMRKIKTEQIFEKLLVDKDKKSDRKCYLSLVGTKSDLVEGNLDKVVELIRKKLKQIIRTGERESLLLQVGGQSFVPVTNLGTAQDKRDPMADKFRNCIYDCLQKRDVYHIPIVWCILELEIQRRTLQENKKVIHFNNVIEICKELDLIENEEDIREALQFLHHIGVFLYYGSDLELKNIEDIVITNYQWVFQNLTQMVKAANSNKSVFEQLRLNGILKEQAISNINWKLENVKKEYFLKLLEKHGIICPTKKDGCEYFMPCVLPTCDNKQKILENFGTQCRASCLLMQIVYEKCDEKSLFTDDGCYLFPTGVFCYLINQLRLNNPAFQVQLSNDDDRSPCVFNNLITFFDEDRCCYVVLINELMYMKVELRQFNYEAINESAFPEIKSVIKFTLEKACKELKLDASDVRIAFQRSIGDEIKCYHMKESNTELKSKSLIMYDIEKNQPVPLIESEKVWFSGMHVAS